MLKHSTVPDAFHVGVVVPIIKDKLGNTSDTDNYRPITLSPMISKLFEAVLLDIFSTFFLTDDLQFGFKKGLSCSSAIFTLRQTVDYFTSRGSNVYLASLDASKAFDRVNHFKLYTCLINAGLPMCLLS
jgi:hypothetical protein